MKRISILLGAFLLLALTTSESAAANAPTFSDDIAPIVFNKCTTCHRPGEAAPFTFMNYREISKRGRLIARVVDSGFMPPWHAKSGDYQFHGDRRLKQSEIEEIKAWVAADMPEGNPDKVPALPKFTDGWQLGKPDLVVKMKEGYTLHAEGPDVYRNFVIPLELKEDKWISAIEFRPGNRSIVHHSLFYFDTEGSARELDAKDPVPGFRRMAKGLQRNAIGGWAVGGTPRHLPGGLAYKLPKGSDLILSTHFHPSGKEETELSTLGIYFTDAPTQGFSVVQLPPVFGALSGVNIPPGEANYHKEDSFVLPIDVRAFGVSAHAHYLGKALDMSAELPDGSKRVLLDIPEWDFSWQEQYNYTGWVDLPKGTKVHANVVWDNSSDNINNPNDPPKWVRWGRESEDEMGSVTLLVVAKNPSELDVLKQSYRDHVRKAASQSVVNRFAGSGNNRKSLIQRITERFDKDGDGKLNRAEQEEARKFYRRNRR
tara:strand:+ start:1360 stop:2814 length:1455 start_codon:yes stop_codon:yes gene_type:complete